MLRISRLTDYATVLLARLAAEPARRFTAAELAAQTRVALPTVSKLLKQLHRSGLVASTRGQRGGYRLSRPAADITAAHILDALEGPLALTECSRRQSQCDIEQSCSTGRAWQRVSLAIRHALEAITLVELSGLDGQPVRFPAFERQLAARRSAP
ncbi:MAG: SUF system Fe-S cluster assembly regulator [Steroidobacteraceae bacterium]